jgi:hypothetical protein
MGQMSDITIVHNQSLNLNMEITPAPEVNISVIGLNTPLTKANIETVLIGQIATHNHLTFYIGATPPENPYLGQGWIDTTLV